MEGKVKFFNGRKGFGFITGEDGKDYFVHFSALPRGIKLFTEDKVSFEPVEGDRGLKAEKVELLQKASESKSSGSEEGEAVEEKSSEDEEAAEE